MTTKDPASDARKTARFDVSLPIRFTEDGENFGEGVVTSLSSIGMFIQTERVPTLGVSVWFDLGFGRAAPPLRGRAKVGTLNRRFGTDVVTGFGVEFDEPREDINDALNLLEPSYPGAVRLDTHGSLVWPILPDSERPEMGHEGDGLRICTPRGWVGAGGECGNEAPAVAVGASLNRPIQDFLDMVRDLNAQVLSCEHDAIEFAYQGRRLGPSGGIPKGILVAGLMALDREEDLARAEAQAESEEAVPTVGVNGTASEEGGEWTLDLTDLDEMPASAEIAPDESAEARSPAPVEPEPPVEAPAEEPARAPLRPSRAVAEELRGRALLDLLAAQMRIVDDLGCGGWRLEHMWSEQLESIEEARALLAESVARLAEIGGAPDAGEGEAPREPGTESVGGVAAVETFLVRVLWNARALTPSDESFRAYDEFVETEKGARAEARAEARAAKEPGKKRLFEATTTTTVRVRATTPTWKIAVAVALVAAAAGAGYWSLRKSQVILDSAKIVPPSSLTVDALTQAMAEAPSAVVMTVEAVSVSGNAVRVTVPSDWQNRGKVERQREFEALVSVLADKGFAEAVAISAEGVERAKWANGMVNLID